MLCDYRIATYNLLCPRQSTESRLRIVHSLLMALQAHIIAVQEYHRGCELLDELLEGDGYGVIKQNKSHERIVATYYRRDLFSPIWQQANKSRMLVVEFRENRDGGNLIVMNCHLDALDRPARIRQLASYWQTVRRYVHRNDGIHCEGCDKRVRHADLESHASSGRHLENGGGDLSIPERRFSLIWLGDFNFTQFDDEFLSVTDAFGLIPVNARIPTHISGRTIDHIFRDPWTDAEWVPDTVATGFLNRTNPSDHVPVCADFAFPKCKGDK